MVTSFLLTVLLLLGATTAVSVVNVSVTIEFDKVFCVNVARPLVISKQWEWLVAIDATTGATAWNVSILETYFVESDETGVLGTFGDIITLRSSMKIFGVDVFSGKLVWSKEIPRDAYSMYAVGQLDRQGVYWVALQRNSNWSFRWLAAYNTTNGDVVANSTIPASCSGIVSEFHAAHYPLALLASYKDYDTDLRTQCMVHFESPTSLSTLWKTTANFTEVDYYLQDIVGNCNGLPAEDLARCTIVRIGIWNHRSGAETAYITNGTAQVPYLQSAPRVNPCYIDGYTEASNFVDSVEGSSAFPAGAVAFRCYSDPRSVLTTLTNVSNLTQVWSQATAVPTAFGDDYVSITPSVVWHVVNQGNEFSTEYMTVDAYNIASGTRPTTSATSWPLRFPDYREEKRQSCSAGRFLAFQARNMSSWNPYVQTLYIVSL